MTYPLLVGLDGAKRRCRSQANNIGARRAARGEFGKAMSIPDDACSRTGGGSSAAAACTPSEPMEAKLELARRIVRALARRRRPPPAAEAHFTRVVREGGAPRRGARARPAGRRSGAPAGGDRRGVRALDERGAAADRAGRGEARRGRGRGARPRSRPSSRARSCRPGSAASPGSSRLLDSQTPLWYTPSAAREGGSGKSLRRGVLRLDSDTTSFVARRIGGLLRVAEAFSLPALHGIGP